MHRTPAAGHGRLTARHQTSPHAPCLPGLAAAAVHHRHCCRPPSARYAPLHLHPAMPAVLPPPQAKGTASPAMFQTQCWLATPAARLKVDPSITTPAMFTAVKAGKVDQVKRFVTVGISPDSADFDDRTPLHLAAAIGSLRMVRACACACLCNVCVCVCAHVSAWRLCVHVCVWMCVLGSCVLACACVCARPCLCT